jgi:hypothetical protein
VRLVDPLPVFVSDEDVMRSRNWLTAAFLVLAAFLFPMLERLAAQTSTAIVISEFRFRGPLGANDEFIELFNAGLTPVNVGGWQIRVSNNNTPPSVATRVTIAAGVVINRGCYYLVVNNAAGGYSGAVPGDRTYTSGFADEGGVAVVRSDLTIADQVGHGANGAFGEGTRLPVLTTNVNRGIERRPGGPAGHVDTNDNAADFQEIFPGNPQSASSACLTPGNLGISGSASPSPVEQGQPVTVFAAVTAGSIPVSTGLQVVDDLSAIGGSASEPFFDNGAFPDVTPNDNVFTAAVTVPSANPVGPQSLALTVTDAQGRSANTTVSLTVNAPPIIYLPHEIQGPGPVSPFPAGMPVIVRGVVTARAVNGFFVQTEAGAEDVDGDTSEGLFMFVSGGAPIEAQVGRLVLVYGSVAEFVPPSDPGSPPRTELNPVSSVIDLGASVAPSPYMLTNAEVWEGGTLDQLERFEGMRVTIPSLTSVTGTTGGTFYAVVTGQARPFRGPGIEAGYPVLACAIGPCNIPVFDGNPERLRVDANAIEGVSPVDLSTGAIMTDVTGPLDFGVRAYTVLPETPLAPVGGLAVMPAPAATANQFTLASFNMERFFDTIDDAAGNVAPTAVAYANRLNKASLAIRTVLNTPDIIGVQEVETLGVLQDIAVKVNADAGTSSPEYVAYLFEGTDQDGLDVGFLVKTAAGRVTVSSIEQVGDDATFVDPADASVALLNDRPPLVLRALVQGPATSLPQSVTVIVNHLQSLTGVELDDDTGGRVRAKRRAQAEFLAGYIQGRQINDPNEAIVSIGGYNAFAFNDGYGDSLGTIRGFPATEDQVVTASPDLVSPDLVDLAAFITEPERYSSVSGGNAQALDHVIVTSNLVAQFGGLAHGRVNADFADVLRGDPDVPQRVSDRDPLVAFFSFPADLVAPAITAGDDVAVEGDTLGGAHVTFAVPTATDNLDGDVAVTCTPASGSLFGVGVSTVTCSASDLAGNTASTQFSVTVSDTVAPSLTLPADIAVQASSSSGAVVTYTVSATDVVSGAVSPACAPASGSTFPVGTTTVQCAADDGAGNTAAGSFTVTVNALANTAGGMVGAGQVRDGLVKALFAFHVRESADGHDRGWLYLQMRPGNRSNAFVSVRLTSVVFANDPGFSPGARPHSGNDSVIFSGTGVWNGHPDHTFEVAATDQGEPGRDRDTFSAVVRAPDGTVVASVSGTLNGGNNQSLR